VLWHFDLELCDESRDWARQKVFILWDKPALNVRLRAKKGVDRRDKKEKEVWRVSRLCYVSTSPPIWELVGLYFLH